MIIVDTSIWIEFFKQNPNFVSEMESLLENKDVITIEPIFSELLYGARSEKEKSKILSYLKILPKIKFTEGSFIDTTNFANKNNHHNLGIGLIDSLILKSSLENNYEVWTLDKKINNNIDKVFHHK